MREGAGAPFKLAFYANRTVILDVVSPNFQVIAQGRERIKSLQHVIGPVEDAEEIVLTPKILYFPASRANDRIVPSSALSTWQLHQLTTQPLAIYMSLLKLRLRRFDLPLTGMCTLCSWAE
jgi:hypothetical protein